MSIFFKHFFGSLERAMKKYPEIYRQEQEKVEQMLWELHKWFDEYFGKSGNDAEGDYDFADPRYSIRHRVKRHHMEGIQAAVKHFSDPGRYGNRFSEIVRQEARQHVIDDMGEILSQNECYQRLFWRSHGN